jgi:hypothetical protein
MSAAATARLEARISPELHAQLNPTVVVAERVRGDGGMHLRGLGVADANTTMPTSAPAQASEARPERAGDVVLPAAVNGNSSCGP